VTTGSGALPTLQLRAPAKVNLGLRLVGLRDDGHHLLESLFVPLSLADEIELSWRRDGPDGVDLTVEAAADANLPPALQALDAGPENLAARAAEAFRKAYGVAGTVAIRLVKRVPAGAGLGGGSSDAGTVLSGLARLTGAVDGVDPGLAEQALGLGADVPYFLAPRPALVSGVGERIESVGGIPPLDLVLANPGISVATAEVYRVADVLRDSLTATGAGSTMRAISRLAGETGVGTPALGDLLVNDLAPAAIRLCPPIGRWLDRLRDAGAIGVGMSGSGGTVFGVFENAGEAERAAAAVRDPQEPIDSNENGDGSWVRVTQVVSGN